MTTRMIRMIQAMMMRKRRLMKVTLRMIPIYRIQYLSSSLKEDKAASKQMKEGNAS